MRWVALAAVVVLTIQQAHFAERLSRENLEHERLSGLHEIPAWMKATHDFPMVDRAISEPPLPLTAWVDVRGHYAEILKHANRKTK